MGRWTYVLGSNLLTACGYDEAKNRLGSNRCSGHNECAGKRTCSAYGWCQGVSGCPVKSAACMIDEAKNALAPTDAHHTPTAPEREPALLGDGAKEHQDANSNSKTSSPSESRLHGEVDTCPGEKPFQQVNCYLFETKLNLFSVK